MIERTDRAPVVSVIIPTYNRAHYLGEAIASVLQQDFADLELIVVDDGSTDATDAVLARFDDARLRIVRQRERTGASAAWAAGCRQARGRYVITLGSDDRWLRHCLDRLTAEATARPEAVLVYGRARAMDERGRSLPRITGSAEPFPGRTLLSILYGDFVTTITALVRRDALEQAGPPDPSIELAADWDLWIRLAAVGPFVFVDEVLAWFRIHPGRSSFTRRDALEAMHDSRVRVLDKAFSRAGLPAEVVAARALVYRNVYVDLGVRWLQVRDLRRACRAFGCALETGVARAGTVARIVYVATYNRLVRRHRFALRLSDAVARLRRSRRSR